MIFKKKNGKPYSPPAIKKSVKSYGSAVTNDLCKKSIRATGPQLPIE